MRDERSFIPSDIQIVPIRSQGAALPEPASGFYEWKAVGKQKQPYLFQRPDGKASVFAGLWEHWDGGDKPLETCTIPTTEANELASAYHECMPVILSGRAIDRWLDHSTKDVGPLSELLTPAPVDFLTAVPVSMLVNSPKNDTPKCIEPISSARSVIPRVLVGPFARPSVLQSESAPGAESTDTGCTLPRVQTRSNLTQAKSWICVARLFPTAYHAENLGSISG